MSFNSVVHCKQKSMPILINPADGADFRSSYYCNAWSPDRDSDFYSPPPDPWRMMYYPFPPCTPGMPPYSYYIYPVFGENLGLGPKPTRSFPCTCLPKKPCKDYFHSTASRYTPRMCSTKLEYYQCPCCNSFFNPLGEYSNVQPPSLIVPSKSQASKSQLHKTNTPTDYISNSTLPKPVSTNAKSMPSSSKSCPAAYERGSNSRDENNFSRKASISPEKPRRFTQNGNHEIRTVPTCRQSFPSYVSLPNENANLTTPSRAAAPSLSSPNQEYSACPLSCCATQCKSNNRDAGKKERFSPSKKYSATQTPEMMESEFGRVCSNTSDEKETEEKEKETEPPPYKHSDHDLDTLALIRALKDFKPCRCSTDIISAPLPPKPDSVTPPVTSYGQPIMKSSYSPSTHNEKIPTPPRPPPEKKEKREKQKESNENERGKEKKGNDKEQEKDNEKKGNDKERKDRNNDKDKDKDKGKDKDKEKGKEDKEKKKEKNKDKKKRHSVSTPDDTPLSTAPSTPVLSQKKPHRKGKAKERSSIDNAERRAFLVKKLRDKKRKTSLKEDKHTKFKRRLKVIDSLKNFSSFTATYPLTLF